VWCGFLIQRGDCTAEIGKNNDEILGERCWVESQLDTSSYTYNLGYVHTWRYFALGTGQNNGRSWNAPMFEIGGTLPASRHDRTRESRYIGRIVSSMTSRARERSLEWGILQTYVGALLQIDMQRSRSDLNRT